MWINCPYGGLCIDPGSPSDCEINSRCVCFTSTDEKAAFDALPDLFILKMNGGEIEFKNKTQVRFFLTDFPHWNNAEFYVVGIDGNELKVNREVLK